MIQNLRTKYSCLCTPPYKEDSCHPLEYYVAFNTDVHKCKFKTVKKSCIY